jgi:heme exporter protein C
MIQKSWWKILAVLLLLYAFIGGLLMPVPRLPIINESIRNLYYHVPMWFGMMVIMTVSVINAIQYLSSKNLLYDIRSGAYANTGIILGILGLVTGAIWANYAWGAPWSNDIKQILAAIALLIYLAYFVLRSSIDDMDKKARVSAVYNIFAYAMLFPTLFILPRLYDSLHPGGEGNPALSQQDIDPTMRIVFWPAVLGWTLLSVWITTLFIRYRKILDKNILHA